ncbi:DUF7487 domain-containing protein [Arthrobacter bambusae]|uniref:DUF7487 domain-containing protein n=1 Tax=Arthrobacter bambusae TaxID=1338426 RepID=A0AAW8DIC7_9MICC|nr:hypothetical protein [Arthrobacter bambusae]MDP9904563.1 hypothetical protein [Arthrobacter bambusae]MDQ0129378.1 hypothetical protein [Arthrobacter bambusae]MDQ0181009.1 hypothetical protein [Arthrobacter bambusae]
MLHDLDSPLDLMLRGFDRDVVMAMTGTDIGYNGRVLRDAATGVDRLLYKVWHVRSRVDNAIVVSTLEAYANGVPKAKVLDLLGLAGENIVKLKVLFTELGLHAEFKDADRRARRGNMREGFKAKHGVDNPFKLSEFQKQATQTRLSKYGGKYTLSANSSLAAVARETLRATLSDPERRRAVLEKRRATVMERLGVDVPMRHPAVVERARQTSREKYGVEHPSQLFDARARVSAFMRENSEELVVKRRRASLAKYGVENPSQRREARAAQSARMRETAAFRTAKAKATNEVRYRGHPSRRKEHREAISAWMQQHAPTLVQKAKLTSLERYGVPHWSQTGEGRAAQSLRMLDPIHQAAVRAAKRANGSFNTSAPEDRLHGLLLDHFGTHDVMRQHDSDERYPWACDFYIPSGDLFIELNGTWTHGTHWFDADELEDLRRLAHWREKRTAFYKAAIEQWTVRDVAKRERAGSKGLNYAVFWGMRGIREAEAWLAAGAPDRQDWRFEHLRPTEPSLDYDPDSHYSIAHSDNPPIDY